jgi:hypothetical protein
LLLLIVSSEILHLKSRACNHAAMNLGGYLIPVREHGAVGRLSHADSEIADDCPE